jgi:hypothetical protein
MKWTVVSVGNADDELTDIWLRAENQKAITEAAERIENVLRSDPGKRGEDFYGDRIYQDGRLLLSTKFCRMIEW